jgi:hypothetical protein
MVALPVGTADDDGGHHTCPDHERHRTCPRKGTGPRLRAACRARERAERRRASQTTAETRRHARTRRHRAWGTGAALLGLMPSSCSRSTRPATRRGRSTRHTRAAAPHHARRGLPAHPPAPSTSDGAAPVLRFGDSGPEVTELQLRLRQIGFYDGDINGDYDRQVENAVSGHQLTRVILRDESGVYGKETRTSLESETSEP